MSFFSYLRVGMSVMVGLLTFLAFAPSVYAFEFSPVIVDVTVEPGATQKGEIEIRNTDAESRTYAVSIQKFVASGENGQQDFLPETDTSGIASWIHPELASVTLEPGTSRSFSYSIRIPDDAEPGGHYAALFFGRGGPNGEGRVAVTAKAGVLFLVRVPGEIVESARLEGFQAQEDRLNRLPVAFDARVRNLGNVHLVPRGEIEIRNMFGSIVAKIPANPSESAVLPNSIRRFDSHWEKAKNEDGGFISEAKNEWRNFAIGRYTAELRAAYGTDGKILAAQDVFWVFPWHLALLGLVLLVIILIVNGMYRRSVIASATRTRKRS